MIHNVSRIGNFTSSEIAALTSNGKKKGTLGRPALTYIAECNMERRLGRSLENEINARPVTWGQLVEKVVFENILPMEYQLVSSETIMHPDYDFWSGSPDANKFDEGRTVCDIKSPMTLKSFCQLVHPLYNGYTGIKAMTVLREGVKDADGEILIDKHKEGETYYWQLVSNAIITNSKYAELIVYAPYQKDLERIREAARNLDSDKQYRYKWLDNVSDDELPYLVEGGQYKDINIIRFEVPEADKILLTERALMGSKYLIQKKQAA